MALTQRRLEAHASVRSGFILVLTLGVACGPAAGAELTAPAAGPPTGVSPTGFTANWSAVESATGYYLDVYRFDGVPPTRVCEGFDNYPEQTPPGWTVANSGGYYASSANCGVSVPSVKLEANDQAVTTAVYPAAATHVEFWYKGQGASDSTLRIDAYNGSGWNTLETFTVSNTATVKACPLNVADGYTQVKLVFTKVVGNVALDDVCVAYGNAPRIFALTNEATGNVTSHAVSNLIPGVYRYVVRATDGVQASADSGEVEVNTEASPVPPVIAPVPPQTARVGAPLTFALAVTTTEGDPVTATNVSVSAGVSGAWQLADGVFRYTPAAGDVGERIFTFTAQDKDGWSDAVAATVTVRPMQVAAALMTGAEGTYAQDFDALASNGTDNVWDNAADPLEAWYAYANAVAVTSCRTGTGTGTVGGLYSFGLEVSADRSLGSLASSANTYRYGVALTNGTGMAVTNLAVAFMAEQWRVGTGSTTNTLTFEFCVTNRVLPFNQGVWRRVNALCFDTPLPVTNESLSAGAAYAQERLSAAITRPVAPGGVVMLRWSDADDVGSDHAFGIDDLSVSWASGPLPDAIPVGRAGATETFDEMGPDAGSELPFLWRVETRDDAPRTSGPYAAAADRAMNRNASSNLMAAGSYHFSAGAEGDYAVGGLSAADEAKSVTVFAKFRNATGRPVRRWNVRYAAEKYRNGLVGCSVRLLFSTDGATWSVAGEPAAFPADADTAGYAREACPGANLTVDRRVAFGLPITQGGVFYLAWQVAVTEGDVTTDAQALGIDDVRVEPVVSGQSALTVR